MQNVRMGKKQLNKNVAADIQGIKQYRNICNTVTECKNVARN